MVVSGLSEFDIWAQIVESLKDFKKNRHKKVFFYAVQFSESYWYSLRVGCLWCWMPEFDIWTKIVEKFKDLKKIIQYTRCYWSTLCLSLLLNEFFILVRRKINKTLIRQIRANVRRYYKSTLWLSLLLNGLPEFDIWARIVELVLHSIDWNSTEMWRHTRIQKDMVREAAKKGLSRGGIGRTT